MASFITNLAKAKFADGTIDWDASTIKVTLVDSTFNGTEDSDYLSDTNIASGPSELGGTNYTRGYAGTIRKTITTPYATQDDTNNRANIGADNITWTAIQDGTAAGVLVFKNGTSDDTDAILIAHIDITPVVTNGGDLTIKWDNQSSAGDILRLT